MKIKTILAVSILIMFCCSSILYAETKQNEMSIKYEKLKFVINDIDEIDCSGSINAILNKYEYEYTKWNWTDIPGYLNLYSLKRYPIRLVSDQEDNFYEIQFFFKKDEKIRLFINGLELNQNTIVADIEKHYEKKSIKYQKSMGSMIVINPSVGSSCFDQFIFDKEGFLDSCSIWIEALKKTE